MNSLVPNILHTRADSDLQLVLPQYIHGSLGGLRSFSFHSLWLQCPVLPSLSQKKRGFHECLHQDGCPGEKRACLSPVPHGSNGPMDRGCHGSGMEYQELPPSTSLACVSSLQAEFLQGLPSLGRSQLFLPPDTPAQLCPTQQLQGKSVWNTS